MHAKNVIFCLTREAYSCCSPLQCGRRGDEQPMLPLQSSMSLSVGGEHLHLQEHQDRAMRGLVGKAQRHAFPAPCCLLLQRQFTASTATPQSL